METLLNRTIFTNPQSPELFAQTLKDGVVLCEIANELLNRKGEQPNTIKYKASTMPFVQVRDNTVLEKALADRATRWKIFRHSWHLLNQ